jgi:hypothetical protein
MIQRSALTGLNARPVVEASEERAEDARESGGAVQRGDRNMQSLGRAHNLESS